MQPKKYLIKLLVWHQCYSKKSKIWKWSKVPLEYQTKTLYYWVLATWTPWIYNNLNLSSLGVTNAGQLKMIWGRFTHWRWCWKMKLKKKMNDKYWLLLLAKKINEFKFNFKMKGKKLLVKILYLVIMSSFIFDSYYKFNQLPREADLLRSKYQSL
jgi:hypothetical protein